ncbi:MAG: group III truncated hemoglobin [Mameliella sp.]|nr:group III truncated hemoglobin [Phaeodactylibacter sp.]
MKDIENREDIKVFVDGLYKRLLEDHALRPFFLEVANLHLAEHLPVIYDFWESVLFQTGNYQGGTLQKHLALHMDRPLEARHFELWLSHFYDSINEHFEGQKTEEAKQKARSISAVIRIKTEHLDRRRQELNN